jgi:hypothetical protein
MMEQVFSNFTIFVSLQFAARFGLKPHPVTVLLLVCYEPYRNPSPSRSLAPFGRLIAL